MRHILGALLLVGTCAFYDDAFKIKLFSFTISPYDFLFIILCCYFILYKLGNVPVKYSLKIKKIVWLSTIGLAFALMQPLIRRIDYPLDDIARDWRVVIYLVGVPLLVQSIFRTEDDLKKFQLYLQLAGIFVVIRFLILFFQFGFSGITEFRSATLAIWVLPFSIISIIGGPNKASKQKTNITNWILGIMFLLVIILSLNRSQYLQLVASLLLYSVFGYIGEKKIIKLALASFAATLIVIAMMQYIGYGSIVIERIETMRRFQNEVSFGSRIEEATKQLEAFYEAPLLGKGPGYRSLVTSPGGWEESVFAHNSIIYYLMKFGVIGSLFILTAPILILLTISFTKIWNSLLLKHKTIFLASYLPYLMIDISSAAWSFSQKALFSGILLGFAFSIIRIDELGKNRAYRFALPSRITISKANRRRMFLS